MTNQISLSPNEVLDLESMDFQQAKDQVKKIYRSIRSDKIRTFFCELVRPYFLSLHKGRVKQSAFAGIIVYDKHELELPHLFGDTLDLTGVFILILGSDISPELAAETIRSISVNGLIFTSKAVGEVVKDRILSGRLIC